MDLVKIISLNDDRVKRFEYEWNYFGRSCWGRVELKRALNFYCTPIAYYVWKYWCQPSFNVRYMNTTERMSILDSLDLLTWPCIIQLGFDERQTKPAVYMLNWSSDFEDVTYTLRRLWLGVVSILPYQFRCLCTKNTLLYDTLRETWVRYPHRRDI